MFGDEPLHRFGKPNIYGISFAYENYTGTLAIRVEYASLRLAKAIRKGWIPCSEIFDNTEDAVDFGEMFPVSGVMYIVTNDDVPGQVTVRNNITGVLSQMPKHIVISILNVRSNS
jgi:hypothetical protein